MAAAAKCPSGYTLKNGKCTDAKGNTISAPYVSDSGALYPDEKSLTSGCAKNPNGPGCREIISKMPPEKRAKIKGIQKLGGTVKKMQDGGIPITKKAAVRKAEKGKGILVGGSRGKGQYVPYTKAGRKEVKETGGTEVYNLKSVRKVMKTGGMVNSNTKATVSKVASGRPVKSAEPKTAAKRATGRTGGTSKAPRTAAPKMKMGGSMKRK